ncbi:MAG: ribonuclease H-like domain-containing protein [Anaerolineales bacterium]|nr:ribonuclease H-like domain-containing protein [Anaerolineales bacterium]
MPSISERLKSLGVKIGTSDLPTFDRTQGRSADRYGIDSVVSGSYHPTALGDVFVAEQTYGPDHRHGETPLLSSFPLSVISQWANDARISSLPIEQFAFLDTETSGLSGGTGTYAFLVGVARFINGEFILQQFFMRDPAEEPALLEGLAQFIAPCALLATFNGKTFDAPLLATRYSMHHMPVPFKNYSHLDLLPLARRLWRDRLPSRTLKYLEEHVLGLMRSDDEVPGYEIPWLYFDYLRTGDARPLGGVFYHNAMDVVTLAALLAHVNNMLMDPYGGHVQHGLDFISLGKLFDDLRKWDEAARLFERGLESQLTEAEFSIAVERLSILQKKRGDLSQAVQLWQGAAKQGHIYAHVELAKYYEHKQRDIKSALKWASAARKHIDKMDAPAYVRAHWQAEIDHRLARLERKAGI